ALKRWPAISASSSQGVADGLGAISPADVGNSLVAPLSNCENQSQNCQRVFFAAREFAMPAHTHSEVTALLQDLHDGNPEAKARLLQSVYDELRRIAAGILRGERPDHAWQPTELVHEMFPHLDFQAQNRSEFFAAATRIMRELVIGHARLRKAQKRGG